MCRHGSGRALLAFHATFAWLASCARLLMVRGKVLTTTPESCLLSVLLIVKDVLSQLLNLLSQLLTTSNLNRFADGRHPKKKPNRSCTVASFHSAAAVHEASGNGIAGLEREPWPQHEAYEASRSTQVHEASCCSITWLEWEPWKTWSLQALLDRKL